MKQLINTNADISYHSLSPPSQKQICVHWRATFLHMQLFLRPFLHLNAREAFGASGRFVQYDSNKPLSSFFYPQSRGEGSCCFCIWVLLQMTPTWYVTLLTCCSNVSYAGGILSHVASCKNLPSGLIYFYTMACSFTIRCIVFNTSILTSLRHDASASNVSAKSGKHSHVA